MIGTEAKCLTEKNDEINKDLFRYYQLENTPLRKIITFNASLSYTEWQIRAFGWTSWDQIIPHLHLGKVLTVAEALKLKEIIPNLGLVVTVLENFESSGQGFPFNLDIQSPSQWRDLNVEHHQLLVPDFTADMPVLEIITTLKKIHHTIHAEKDVYVHCKAGRGRSATLIFLYLYFYGSDDGQLQPRKTCDEIYTFLKSKRSQVELKERNFKKILEVVALVADHDIQTFMEQEEHNTHHLDDFVLLPVKHSVDEIKSLLDSYLVSIKAKQVICQLNSFKDLVSYALQKQHYFLNSNRTKQVQQFLYSIYYAHNADWYSDLLNNKGPLQNLLDARPYRGLFGSGEAVERKKIVDYLKLELTQHFASIIGCSAEMLQLTCYTQPCAASSKVMKKFC